MGLGVVGPDGLSSEKWRWEAPRATYCEFNIKEEKNSALWRRWGGVSWAGPRWLEGETGGGGSGVQKLFTCIIYVKYVNEKYPLYTRGA